MEAVQQLPNTNPAEENPFVTPEGVEAEVPEQTGFLPLPKGKYMTFTPHRSTTDKSSKVFSKTQNAPPKKIEKKSPAKSFKKISSESKPTLTKTDQAAQKPLQRPKSEQPPATRTLAPFMEKQTQQQLVKKQQPQANKEIKQEGKKRSEGQRQQNTQVKEQKQKEQLGNKRTEKEHVKAEEKEEGAIQEEREKKKDDAAEERDSNKVKGTSKKGIDPEEFDAYAAEESTLLSELFNMRVNHFDVLVLFIEVMKLSLKGREQERISRMQEREMQLIHMQNVVDNYKQQAKWMLFTNLGAGVFGIASGALPIIGHLKGDWILDKLGGISSKIRDMNAKQRNTFFKSVSQITRSMSEMQKSTGEIQRTFSESSRVYDQHMSDLYKSDWEEDTRSMEELKDHWKNIENFLHQSLQMYHDVIRQLYS